MIEVKTQRLWNKPKGPGSNCFQMSAGATLGMAHVINPNPFNVGAPLLKELFGA